MPHSVTLSRSEGPVALGFEMLRSAQHDSLVPPAAPLPSESVPLVLPLRMLMGLFLS